MYVCMHACMHAFLPSSRSSSSLSAATGRLLQLLSLECLQKGVELTARNLQPARLEALRAHVRAASLRRATKGKAEAVVRTTLANGSHDENVASAVCGR